MTERQQTLQELLNKLEINSFDTDKILNETTSDTQDKFIGVLKDFICNDEKTIHLPIKPFSFFWMAEETRMIINGADEDFELPKNCTGTYSELCETCKYNNKECISVAVPTEKWFYLDSPYVSTLLNNWETLAFDNEEDCKNACVKMYGEHNVNTAIEMMKMFQQELENNTNFS